MNFGLERNNKGIRALNWLNGLTTFSFAVFYSSLSLYFTKEIGLSQFQSNSLVGFFLASNFTLHFISGYIGDRLLSNRYLLAISITIQTIGLFILSFSSQTFVYFGLSLFLIGCGFGSTCINCLLTQQYDKNEDQARETGFFYNYSAMNIGFLSGFIFAGFIDLKDNYEIIFEISNLINIISLILIFKSWSYFDNKKKITPLNLKQTIIGLISVISLVPTLLIGFYYSGIANYLILSIGITTLMYIFSIGFSANNSIEKGNIYSYLILTGASIIFWMLYFVGPIGLAQFLKHNMKLSLFGYHIPPQWIMNLNAMCVIFGSPLLAMLFSKLRKRNIIVPITRKFIFSLLLISISFFILAISILCADWNGLINGKWIIVHFILLSMGELLIAPVGDAMIGKLASEKLQGVMMGAWMMTSGISATLSHHFSNIMTKSESLNPLISNHHYFDAFSQLGVYALVACLIIILFSSLIENNINKSSEQNLDHDVFSN